MAPAQFFPQYQQGFGLPQGQSPLPMSPLRETNPTRPRCSHAHPQLLDTFPRGTQLGLTHLPQRHHRPRGAQPAPARLCLAPGGTRALSEQTPPCCWTHPKTSTPEGLGVQLNPRGWEWEGSTKLSPSSPSHLTDMLHAPLAPGQNPIWLHQGAAHPPWGQNGRWH